MDSLKATLRQSRGYALILVASLILALLHSPDHPAAPTPLADPAATVEVKP